MPRALLCGLAGLVLAATAGSAVPQDDLKRLVHQDCGSCHGLTLTGGLGPDLRPEALAGRGPDMVKAIILDGIPGTAMPPWRPLLTDAEAAWIAEYLLQGGTP